MRKYVIERDIPAVGTLERDQLRDAAKTSNATGDATATRKLWPTAQRCSHPRFR